MFFKTIFYWKNNRISDFSIINKELSFTNKKGFAFYQKKELWNNHKWMVPIFISLVKSLFNRNAPWINLAFWATKWCEVKNLGFIETFIILVSQLLSDPAWFWWQLSSCCAVIGLESNSTGSVVHVHLYTVLIGRFVREAVGGTVMKHWLFWLWENCVWKMHQKAFPSHVDYWIH